MSPYEAPAGGGSGEIEQYRPESRDVRRLRDWAEAATAAHAVARSLVKTSFVPPEYRHKPDDATAAILAGFELGFDPIQSISAFSPIGGRAAPKAQTLHAVVLSAGHEMELIESTARRCVMRGRRRGAETWQTITWTIEQARELGLIGRNAEWRKQPGTMLQARCKSQLARLIAPDAIMGIPYSAEELRDSRDADDDAATDAPARRRRGTAVRPEPAEGSSSQMAAPGRTQAGPPPLPGEAGYPGSGPHSASEAGSEEVAEVDGGPAAETDDEDARIPPVEETGRRYVATPVDEAADEAAEATETESDMDPDAMLRRVFELLREVKIGDRHLFASDTLGRKVTTYNGLAVADLRALIDRLESLRQKNDDAG